MLWRALRGNLYMRHSEIEEPIEDPDSGEPIKKDVFVIFSHGEQLQGKIRKIADSFGATLYPAPDNVKARIELAEQVTQRMNDMQTVLQRTQSHRKTQLETIRADINNWVVRIRSAPKQIKNCGMPCRCARADGTRAIAVAPSRDARTDHRPQGEGDLPLDEHVQPGHHLQVPRGRGLVPRRGPERHPGVAPAQLGACATDASARARARARDCPI